MKSRKLYLIIFIMAEALIGIVVLQVYWIREGLLQENERFELQASNALRDVSARLEQWELDRQVKRSRSSVNVQFNVMGQGKLTVSGNGQQQEVVIVQDKHGRTISVDQRGGLISNDGLDSIIQEEVRVFVEEGQKNEPGELTEFLQGLEANPGLTRMMVRAYHQVVVKEKAFDDRVKKEELDSLINQVLDDNGIDHDYEFMVLKAGNPQPVLKSEEADEEALLESPIRTNLYPSFTSRTPSYLKVRFPNQPMFVWRGIARQAFVAVIYTLLILAGFAYTLISILRQKKLSEMKNDFVNNMTHELKTPLATISLATDALKTPIVGEDAERRENYLRIIKEENQRMNRQVERVLQMARSEVKLEKVPLHVHELVAKVAEPFLLQVNQRDGTLLLDLEAQFDHLQGDEVHLGNVLSCLLDNANKYSPDAPHIKLSTYNEGKNLIVEVEDNGMGISKADQNRIFDRFYRVSTGNLHDVKGFGLGLSYVQETVHAHGGTIEVESKVGKGSLFRIQLPLQTVESR
ncbi:MAG: HAMP domain-containing sensor histidine kinase [Bacteroidota bacterium]